MPCPGKSETPTSKKTRAKGRTLHFQEWMQKVRPHASLSKVIFEIQMVQ